jgi:undecaprenyl pyrophosphate phosphatase UppP
MATPITLGAVIWEFRKLLSGDSGGPVDAGILVAGMLAAAAAGFVAIAVLLRYLRNHPMTIFVVYRLVLAGVVVVHFLSA